MTKYVYFFGAGKAEGNGDDARVAGRQRRGTCGDDPHRLAGSRRIHHHHGVLRLLSEARPQYPKELAAQVDANSKRLEKVTGKRLGDAKDPLLVSVRSGSARSMPGMMETILNLG